MAFRLILVAGFASAWFWLLHATITLPAPMVLGFVGWAVLMTVTTAVYRQRWKEVSFMGKSSKKSAVDRLRKARKDLAALPNTKDETPEYRRRNAAVVQAEKAVPWWRR